MVFVKGMLLPLDCLINTLSNFLNLYKVLCQQKEWIINNQNKTITRNGAYNADEGYTGLGTVNVNVEPLLGTKSVTENGTYNAGDDMVQGYSSVEVNVSPNVMEKNITSNGEFVSQNDGVDGYNIVRVNVEPLLGTKTVTTNGTYNAEDDMVQGYSSITVNVPTGGGTPVKSNIYRVPTIEARDAITDLVEGDMCAVIENEVRRITIGDKLKTILFPETVVLDSPIGVDPETGSEVFLNFNISKGSYRLEGQCTKSRFELMYEDMNIGDMGQVVRYESSDGLTYTRREGSMEKYVIPIDYTVSEYTYDDDNGVCTEHLINGSTHVFFLLKLLSNTVFKCIILFSYFLTFFVILTPSRCITSSCTNISIASQLWNPIIYSGSIYIDLPPRKSSER